MIPISQVLKYKDPNSAMQNLNVTLYCLLYYSDFRAMIQII